MLEQGSFTIARLRGAPVRLHWSVLVGGLLWSRFNFEPVLWAAFALLIMWHELGHAAFVLRFRLGLAEVLVHGAGGYCRHHRTGSAYQEAAIAWGGVLAQALLYLATLGVVAAFGPPSDSSLAQIYYVFTYANLWTMAFNLIPIEPLDGAKAWPLLGMLRRRWAAAKRARSSPFGGRAERPRGKERDPRAYVEADPREANEDVKRIVRDLIDRTTKK